MFRVGILTVSDRGHAGERDDTAGPELGRLLDTRCFQVTAGAIVPTSQRPLRRYLRPGATTTAWT